jgi:hypothetical protein
VGHSVQNGDFVVFHINVASMCRTWLVKRRFSHFDRLHKALKYEFRQSYVPPIDRKRLRRFGEKGILIRQSILAEFLRGAAAVPALCGSNAFHAFLEFELHHRNLSVLEGFKLENSQDERTRRVDDFVADLSARERQRICREVGPLTVIVHTMAGAGTSFTVSASEDLLQLKRRIEAADMAVGAAVAQQVLFCPTAGADVANNYHCDRCGRTFTRRSAGGVEGRRCDSCISFYKSDPDSAAELHERRQGWQGVDPGRLSGAGGRLTLPAFGVDELAAGFDAESEGKSEVAAGDDGQHDEMLDTCRLSALARGLPAGEALHIFLVLRALNWRCRVCTLTNDAAASSCACCGRVHGHVCTNPRLAVLIAGDLARRGMPLYIGGKPL